MPDAKEDVNMEGGKAKDEKENEDFLMVLAHNMYCAVHDEKASDEDKKAAVAFVGQAIRQRNMVSVWEFMKAQGKLPDVSEAEVKAMEEANKTKISALDSKLKDAEENFGESEIRSALLEKADFFLSIGDKDAAVSQYRLTEEKSSGVGPKLDTVFSVLQIALLWDDVQLTKQQVKKAQKLLDEGGDWERRNRLKVYEALHLARLRQFESAAKLMLESIATFSCPELMDYKQFIRYTVVLSLVSCDRPTLKAKVVHAPEVLQVIREMPHLQQLLTSLYDCNYRSFFEALAAVSDTIVHDRFLGHHYTHYMREMRIRAYSQFLQPYRSVSLKSMADSFGVGVDFLDSELSRFIAAGRLPCKIDKIAGLVEAQRPDSRNATYQQIIKDGDHLLNRVQKLSRVINV